MQEKVKEKAKKQKNMQKAAETAAVWRARLLRLAIEALWVGGGCLLGQAPMAFDTRPLGLALLCASHKHILSVLIGLIVATLWQPVDPVVYICTYLAAALVRTVTYLVLDMPESRPPLPDRVRAKLSGNASGTGEEISSRMELLCRQLREGEAGSRRDAVRRVLSGVFTESLRLRMVTGAVCSFILSLYRIIAGGFQYYDLFAAIFVLLLTPASIMVYSVCLGEGKQPTVLLRISQAALLFSLVYASGRVLLLGMPLGIILGLLATLYACERLRYGEGLAASLLCGLAYEPLYTPAFLLTALVYLLFKSLGRKSAGMLVSCLSALIWVVFAGGVERLPRFLPAALLSGCLAGIILRLHDAYARPREEGDAEDPLHSEETSSLRLQVEGTRYRDANDRFRGISEAFSSLSEMFYNLSDRFRRPGTLDLHRLCDSAFDRYCADCPGRAVCWGLEYSETLNTVNRLIAALHTKGRVSAEQIPESLARRCESVEAILARINEECARLTCEMLRNNRTEIFAMDYASAASIINDALEEDDGEYRFDEECAARIAEYLVDAGVHLQGVTVFGNRRRRIMVRGVDMEGARVTVDTMCSDLGELCGMELGRPTFEVEGAITTMTLQAKRKIAIRGAQNNLSSDGGVSGDTVNLFSGKKDYFYALINDGMGAGREAALTSGLCSVFLEKMLRAGNRASTSLKMLNNMIRSRGVDSAVECSSTVDLLELDLMTATASFIKSGAAPSFVIRRGVVHRLQSGTAPIGIIGTLDVQSTTFYVKEGDTVVMISDGILQDDPECVWLSEYLAGADSLTPEEIVYRICVHAAGQEKHDDCSAIALRIEAVAEEATAKASDGKQGA